MAHPTPLDERQAYIDEREAWRRSLPPSPVPDFLTGLNLRAPDPRDWNLALQPGVAEMLRVGYPETADLTRYFPGPVLNQGAVPSCVCHAMSHQQAILQFEEERIARVFDAPRAHQETGPVSNGRDPGQILEYAKNTGMPLTGSGVRYKIASYAFAPKTGQWAESIKAAIAAERPVPIAYLLPSSYGWESSGSITQGYHETLIVGYRADAFLMLNSWGAGWGRNGLGWVPISFLTQNNWQQGYVIAHSGVFDERTNPMPPIPDPPVPDPPVPDPPTPSRVKVYALAAGGGLEMLRPGITLAAQGEGFQGTLAVERVDRDTTPTPDPPTPDPPIPGDLTVSPKLYPARGGYNLFVTVTGPGEGAAQVTLESSAQVWQVRREATLDGRLPATAAVRGATAGTQIHCIAEAGGLRGEATVAVPGVSRMDVTELPPLVDEC